MKYKITMRGWIVFSILGLLLLVSIFAAGKELLNTFASDTPENDFIVNETSTLGDDESLDGLDSRVDLDKTDTEKNNVSKDDTSNSVDDEQSDTTSEDQENSTIDADSDKDSESITKISEDELTKRTEIIFEKNNADLKTSYYDVLDEWLILLRAHDGLEIVIEGHINGYPNYNDGTYGLTIALNRAESVKNYLVESGIQAARIELVNLGSSEQSVLTDDTAQHYLNRRAIVYIKENKSE